MGRRRHQPKPPPVCRDCGQPLAWLPSGQDSRKPVDPHTRMLIDLDGEPTHSGYDRYGYWLRGAMVESESQGRRVVEVWNYHACEPSVRTVCEHHGANDPRVPD